MTNNILDIQSSFKYLLLSKIQNKLSGTSVMSIIEIERVANSICFVLNHNHQTTDNIFQAFDLGKEVINKKKLLQQYEVIQIKKLEVLLDSESYQQSFTELNKFFKTYDVEYNADVLGEASFDYQLSHPIDDHKFKGIDFVEKYIDSLKKESLFISKLPTRIVQEILTAYQKRLAVNYQIDINNLYEVIFNQVIAKCMVGGKIYGSALLTQTEKTYLSTPTNKKIPRKIKKLIDSDNYYKKSFKKLINNLKLGLINQLLYVSTYENSNKIILNEGMSENQYLSFLEQLNELEGRKRITYLVDNISSPFDLAETVRNEYFSEEDFLMIVTSLSKENLFQYVLYLKQQTGNEINSLEELINFALEDHLMKYLTEVDESLKSYLNLGLRTISIDILDLN